MPRKKTIQRTLSCLAMGAILFQTAACGFILYPERKGRTMGRIDPGVAILDAILLIPGILPGVIAFAVDFTTGCIYMSGRSLTAQALGEGQDPLILERAAQHLDIESVEHLISEKAGKTVHLDPGQIRLVRVNDAEFIEQNFITNRG